MLGTAEVTLEELTTLYAMLANFGTYKPLRKVLNLSFSQKRESSAVLPQLDNSMTNLLDSRFHKNDIDENHPNLLSPEASYLTLDIIKDTVRPLSYTKLDLPIYWKTGTSSSFRDGISVGIFGRYVLLRFG